MSEKLKRLYAAHLERSIPRRLHTVKFGDLTIAALESSVVACVKGILRRGGLDPQRAALLARDRAELERMLPLTDPHEVAYVSGLRELAAACHADRPGAL